MRRGVGIGGLQKQASTKETFRGVGQAVDSAQFEQLKNQLEIFKTNLESFARKHQKEINKNPLLRAHFHKMCSSIGVDPLASSKGFWAEVLGVGDFYYELGIQIVESCILMQEKTGGLSDLEIIKRRIGKLRGQQNREISDDDVNRAVKTLSPLGSGYTIIEVGSRKLVQSLPMELSSDGTMLLSFGEGRGFVTEADTDKLNWQIERFHRAIDGLIHDGLIWVDDQDESKNFQYWFPTFYKGFE